MESVGRSLRSLKGLVVPFSGMTSSEKQLLIQTLRMKRRMPPPRQPAARQEKKEKKEKKGKQKDNVEKILSTVDGMSLEDLDTLIAKLQSGKGQ